MTQNKQWTVLVWIAGDNDLEDFGADDIQEMKRVESNDDLNIVVQYDRMSDHPTLIAPGTETGGTSPTRPTHS